MVSSRSESFSFLKLIGAEGMERSPSYKSFENKESKDGEEVGTKRLSDTIT